MKRSIEQWRGMKPQAVSEGSQAQIIYCIEDAKNDIIQLYAENWAAAIEIERLRKALEGLLAWRERPEILNADFMARVHGMQLSEDQAASLHEPWHIAEQLMDNGDDVA